LQVNGLDVMTVLGAVQYAREWTIEHDKGPLLLEFVSHRYRRFATYRYLDHDPIEGLRRYVTGWGLATEQELEELDREVKAHVNVAVEEALASPEPALEDFWTDIYHRGSEPPHARGRERKEVHRY